MRTERIRGFSLMEMLLVIALITVISAIVVPSVTGVVRSHKLTTATQALIGDLDFARQTAASRNRAVEFRLYKLPPLQKPLEQPETFRGYQIFLMEKGKAIPLTEVKYLPAPVAISPDAVVSSLLDTGSRPLTRGADLPAARIPACELNYQAAIFRFTPDGSTDLAQDRQWFVSLVLDQDPIVAKNLPANYSTIQIDPFNGRTLVYRPQ